MSLAQVLATWALDPLPKRILEPAFGDGVFLHAAHAVLEKSGLRLYSDRLFGVEIDPAAVEQVRESRLRLESDQLFLADLLTLAPADLGGRFSAIIGNPPYIRHHLLAEGLAERGRKSARKLGVELNGRSDAWAYFCAHLVSFLDDDGRLALVLPGSVLQADYAAPLIKALGADKGEVQLIEIKKRLFRGVQERTVVLLIDRAKHSTSRMRRRQVRDVAALKKALKATPKRKRRRGLPTSNAEGPESQDPDGSDFDGAALGWRLTKAEAELYERVCSHGYVSPVGELAKIRIGVVTGANDFFVRSRDQIDELGPGLNSKAIVSRGGWLHSPSWRAADQRKVAANPSRLLLLHGQDDLPAPTRAAITIGEENLLHERHHCSKRDPWYVITDEASPQMFLPYMGAQPPRIVVNHARATCTNAVHRLWLKSNAGCSCRRVAAASWSSLYLLSAELNGRSYGGGVLKLEPGKATNLQLPLPPSVDLLANLEEAYRIGGTMKARELADRRLLVDGVGLTMAEIRCLRGAAERLRDLRTH